MEEIFENDDALKKLIRKEGSLTTSSDFTLRVMQLLEESEKKASHVYKPLLGRKAWTLIAASMLMLIIFCWWAIASDNPGKSVYSGTVEPAIDFLKNIDFSIHFNTSGLLIATIAIACISVLLSLDILLSHKYREASA
jgi:hypothetical protein